MPGPRRHSSDRRKPPQEATGEERRFLNGRLKVGGRLRIELTDGSTSLGVIRSFNEDTIEFGSDERPDRILRKTRIRIIEELD